MRDWKEIVRDRIARLHLEGSAEADLTEEFAQHLEDRYTELRSGGESEAEAYRQAISELDDLYPLSAGGTQSRRLTPYSRTVADNEAESDVARRPGKRPPLRVSHDAKEPAVCVVCCSDASPGDWGKHNRIYGDQHADSESAANSRIRRAWWHLERQIAPITQRQVFR